MKQYTKLIYLTVLILLIMSLAACDLQYETKKIRVGQATLTVEIADTLAKQNKGLSGRPDLTDDHGMLFVYSDKKTRKFWMKDMNFAIDIIWLNGNKIVELTENLQPAQGAKIPSYLSKNSVNGVLEVKAGFIAKNGLKIGQNVEFLANND